MNALSPQEPQPEVPALSLRGITKRFPGVVANDRVDFEAAAGEVHALLGENGAGKTTLSHILTGLYRPDEGQIFLYGRPVSFGSPRDAIDAGICMVHQHFRLVERFTVAENVVLGDRRGAGRHFRIDPRRVEDQVRELALRYQLPVDPGAHIWQLSMGEQQRVEILNALYQDAKVLILDEPTSVLTPNEADALFVTLRQMAEEGRTVIFISHKLHEVSAVSDRVTVLRLGKTIATVPTAGSTPHSLASLMMGRALENGAGRKSRTAPGPPALEIEALWANGDRGTAAVKGVSLVVRRGEIVAIAGVAGNGQRELAEAVAGLRARSRGTVRVEGRAIRAADARAAFAAGVGYVPEDRLGTGVAPNLPITMNLELKAFRQHAAGPFLRLRRMRASAVDAISAYDIKVPDPSEEAGHLSGGNLQKLVLAREFSSEPTALVAACPTRGLDVGAVATVHSHLLRAAADGTAILLISEDIDEILALADRIYVMYEGALSEVPAGAGIAEIGLLMAGEPIPAAPSPEPAAA